MVKIGMKINEAKEKIRVIKPVLTINTMRFQYLTQIFQHYNTYIERGIVARRFAGFIREAFVNTWKIGRIQKKILGTSIGKKWFVDTVLDVLAKRLEEEKLKDLRIKLDNLVNNNESSGKTFVREVESKIRETLGVEYKSIIEHAIKTVYSAMMFIKFGEYGNGKLAIYDISSGKLYTTDKKEPEVLEIKDHKSYGEIIGKLVGYNIKLSREDYYNIKNSKLIVRALVESVNERDARNLYVKLHSEELTKDPYFSAIFQEKMRSEVVRTYNAAAMMTIAQDTLTKLPSYLVTMLSRLLSRAVAVIPIIGSIASIHYEAAGAITELGDRLSDRLQSSAHMWYSPSATVPIIKEAFMKQIQQQQEILQQSQRTQTQTTINK